MSDSLIQYQAIQSAQKLLRIAVIAPPLIIFLFAWAVPAVERYILLALPFIWLLPCAFLGFRVQALNSCPWCKLSFISKHPMLQGNGLRLLSAKNCANCGMPSHKEQARANR